MAEKKTQQKKYDSHIPEEAREHFRAARAEMRAGMKTLFPDGFFDHGKNARREMLLAWRSILDSAIERID